MIKIYIFADSYKHFETPIKEYKKRLWKDVQIVKLKPSKKNTESEIIQDETLKIYEKIKTVNAYKIVLSPLWKNLGVHEFSKVLEDNIVFYPEIIFIIWWAYGLHYDYLQPLVNMQMSFGKSTFPHAMVLTILLEQIYRVVMIKKWSSYHK